MGNEACDVAKEDIGGTGSDGWIVSDLEFTVGVEFLDLDLLLLLLLGLGVTLLRDGVVGCDKEGTGDGLLIGDGDCEEYDAPAAWATASIVASKVSRLETFLGGADFLDVEAVLVSDFGVSLALLLLLLDFFFELLLFTGGVTTGGGGGGNGAAGGVVGGGGAFFFFDGDLFFLVLGLTVTIGGGGGKTIGGGGGGSGIDAAGDFLLLFFFFEGVFLGVSTKLYHTESYLYSYSIPQQKLFTLLSEICIMFLPVVLITGI